MKTDVKWCNPETLVETAIDSSKSNPNGTTILRCGNMFTNIEFTLTPSEKIWVRQEYCGEKFTIGSLKEMRKQRMQHGDSHYDIL